MLKHNRVRRNAQNLQSIFMQAVTMLSILKKFSASPEADVTESHLSYSTTVTESAISDINSG